MQNRRHAVDEETRYSLTRAASHWALTDFLGLLRKA